MKINDTLYIIVSYFNYNGNEYREKNIQSFIEKNSNNKVKILVVEAVYNNLNRLKSLSSQVFSHLTYNIKHPICLQENLINIGIKNLPQDWQYLAWIDSDIIFNDKNWVYNIIKELQDKDIIHCYKEADFLNKDNSLSDFKFLSESYIYINNIKDFKENERAHCGFGWALTRSFYEDIKEIFDSSIVGGNDRVISYTVFKKPLEEYFSKTSYSQEYKDLVFDYYNRKQQIKFGYADNKITHLWHGNFENRNYHSRKNILRKYKFNPKRHLIKDENGIFELTKEAFPILPHMENYFNLKEKIY